MLYFGYELEEENYLEFFRFFAGFYRQLFYSALAGFDLGGGSRLAGKRTLVVNFGGWFN